MGAFQTVFGSGGSGGSVISSGEVLSLGQARDEMRRLFFEKFNHYVENGLPNNSPPISPLALTARGSVETYVPGIEWENIQKYDVDKKGKHWIRFASRNVKKEQRSLAGGRNRSVGTCYTTNGLVIVELYFAKSSFQSKDFDNLNTIVEHCFIQANTPGGVWFRNTVIVEMEPEETYFRSNVLTEYEFDSVIQ